MKRSEVIDLLGEIKENYFNFDVSEESIRRHMKYLADFPLDQALYNVEQHVKTDRFPPAIADIRGRLGDQLESERSKQATQEYFAELERARTCDSAPPVGFWQNIRSMLQGERT